MSGTAQAEWHLVYVGRLSLRERNASFAEQKATLDGFRM